MSAEQPTTDLESARSPDAGMRKRRAPSALVAGVVALAVVVATATLVAVVSAGGGPVVPAGWEERSFKGMTFAVPPGARMPDEIEEGDPSYFTWNGPGLGLEGTYATVQITVREHSGDIPPQDGAEVVPVPGALRVRYGVGPAQYGTAESDGTVEATYGAVQIWTADAFVMVGVTLPAGPEGEQTARNLVASIDLTGLDP
jgi:hypothetical protein